MLLPSPFFLRQMLRSNSYLESMAAAKGTRAAVAETAVINVAQSPEPLQRQASSTPMKQQSVSFAEFALSPVVDSGAGGGGGVTDFGSDGSGGGSDTEAPPESSAGSSHVSWWSWMSQVCSLAHATPTLEQLPQHPRADLLAHLAINQLTTTNPPPHTHTSRVHLSR